MIKMTIKHLYNSYQKFFLGGLLFLACFIAQHPAQAQYAYFPNEGVITYEKTVHAKNLLRRHINNLGPGGDIQGKYYEQLMGQLPETVVFKKKLSFRGEEALFESEKGNYSPMISMLISSGLLDYNGTSYLHLGKKISKTYFEMGGSPIYIEDQLLDVKWKLTNEYRNIAGFDCRRANGLTLDSVYVVAFFTDQIPTSAGPSNLHGLPGMILGLAVPEQHFSIYATKVDYSAPQIKSEIAGKRDKAMTRQQLMEQMNITFGQYMSPQQRNLLYASMFL